MSENQENNALQEVSRKVVITPEDCQGAAEFWTHFEVPMPEELKLAFDTFAADPTFENQDKIRLTIARAIAYTPHDAFRDEMFKEVVEECKAVEYDMGFDQNLEAALLTTNSLPPVPDDN
jgi:hypothetical protein